MSFIRTVRRPALVAAAALTAIAVGRRPGDGPPLLRPDVHLCPDRPRRELVRHRRRRPAPSLIARLRGAVRGGRARPATTALRGTRAMPVAHQDLREDDDRRPQG